MSDRLLDWTIAVAAIGPAAAGLVWLGLSRWPRAARIGLWAVILVAHAAAWAVFWFSYRGDEVVWRGLRPTLLGATLVAATEIGVVLALLRAGSLAPRRLPSVVLGLTIGASAVAYGAYVDSLLVMALFFPVTTLACATVSLADAERADVRGLLTLAIADAVIVTGLSVVEAHLGTTMLGPDPGGVVPYGLLLGGAALKAGAIPGLGSWRLTSAGGPAALLTPVLRGQALILAGVVALQVGAAREADPGAIAAGAALLLNGVAAVLSRQGRTALAGALGAALCVVFLALTLGGGVGARAFLVLAPAFLLASGMAMLLFWVPTDEDLASRERDRPTPRAVWGWLGAAAAAVVLGSLAGLPPGGGFPGSWLTLALATTRGLTEPLLLAVAGAAAVGLAVTFLASVPLSAAVRTRAVPAVVGVLGALGLLYLGLQPVRLGIGWWLRVEEELGLPALLPAAEAPDLPPVGGLRLAAVLAPALLLVALVIVLGRGFREARQPFAPVIGARESRLERPLAVRAVAVLDRPRRLGRRAAEQGLGFGVALVFEVGALVLAARLLLIGARSGFL
jgi:hypothetical protein